MRKVYLVSCLALIAFGLMITSCNKTEFSVQQNKEEEFTNNFQNILMGGKTIDPKQTWSTTTATNITVESELSGTLMIYTNNPIGENVAALFSQYIEAGTYNFTITKPNDAESLYAALVNEDGSLEVIQFSNTNSVSFKSLKTPATKNNRRAQKKYGKDFPDAPDPNIYKTTKPNGISNLGTYQASDEEFYIDETNSNKNAQLNGKWGSDHMGAIYVIKNGGNGIVAPSFFFMQADNNLTDNKKAHLYICNGATLKLSSSDSGNLQGGLIVSIAKGATLECAGELKLNSCTIYNNGTIIAPKISANGTGILYNQNTVEVEGDLSVTNATSFIVNEGDIIVGGNYGSEGSGSFWNVSGSTMTVTGETIINSNCNGWINEGVYTTNNFSYTAGSTDVWNNCKLKVNNLFSMILGSSAENGFSMEGGASVEAGDTYLGANSRIVMGSNSLFKTIRTVTMNNTCNGVSDGTQGIFGPSTGWAVFQAANIVKPEGNSRNYVSYHGNLYIASDSHFANGHDGGGMVQGHQFYYLYDNSKIYEGQNAAPITISKNTCNPGYNGGNIHGIKPKQYYYYAFEDLGTTDDFDFNDVVVRVAAPENGESEVELIAAGGTLVTYVTYGTGNDKITLGGEVHEEFGETTNTMVNTGYGSHHEARSLGKINVGSNADLSNLPLGINIKGNGCQVVRVSQSVENNGKAPLVIVTCGYPSGQDAGKWFWPKERTMISKAYNKFGDWGNDVSKFKNWYRLYTDDNVYKW